MWSRSLLLVLAIGLPPLTAVAQLPSQQTSSASPDPCNHPATATHIAEPKAPASAYAAIKGSQTVATVQVWSDEKGRPTNERIVSSSGSAVLDEAALSAAKASTFNPAAAGCGTVPSTFAIQITFQKTDYACNHEAQALTEVVPGYPPAANRFGAFRHEATVRVRLDARGNVIDASIALSSGVDVLDAAALEAARESTYEPKYVACKPVPGTFLVKTTFVRE